METLNFHHGRQDLSNPEVRTCANHQSKRSAKYTETRRTHLEENRSTNLDETRRAKYEETRCGNVDYRIPKPFWLKSYLGPSEHCGSLRPRVSQVSF